MKKIIKWLLVLIGIVVLGITGLLGFVKFGLPNLNEAEDLKIEYTPERIQHGEYLAKHVMICVDCHSKRDFSRFAGPIDMQLAGSGGELFGREMNFPGNFYSRNITPHGLKDWTDGELFRTITTGMTKDGSALFALMPYHNYGQLDREDIYSVIAYVRTLKPIENHVPASEPDFPMNFIINTMPKEASFSKKPAEEDLLAYGKYVFTAASCNECHTQKVQGEPLPGMFLAGGFEFPLPNKTVVRSANITPDMETGIGKWTEEEFVNRFKKYSDSTFVAQPVGPGEFQTVMPWLFYTGMKETDLKAIYAYLKTVPAVSNNVTKTEPLP
jgi:mono/diheme cytochrome c family protein